MEGAEKEAWDAFKEVNKFLGIKKYPNLKVKTSKIKLSMLPFQILGVDIKL